MSLSTNNPLFVAIVGTCHDKKSTLSRGLQEDPRLSHCSFVFDTGAHQGENGNPVVRGITAISKMGLFNDFIHPIAQLFLFWARLVLIIIEDIVPCLTKNTPVVMVGFGGSVLIHALAQAKTEKMRTMLIALHDAIVSACVFGMGIYPPIYLYLEVDPESIPDGPDKEAQRERAIFWGEAFKTYAKDPRQCVKRIPASGTDEEILACALAHILPKLEVVTE